MVSFLLHLTTAIAAMEISQRKRGMNGIINSPVFSHDTPSEAIE
jgi:hypothetical protein